MTDEIWTFVEHDQGAVSEASQEVLTEGKKIAAKLGTTLCGVLLGHQVTHLVQQLASFGARRVYLADSPVLGACVPDAFVSVLAGAVRKHRPSMILMSSTPLGRELAATLAGRLRLGLASDCTLISVDASGEVQANRPVFAGKASAAIAFTSNKPWLATLRTGIASAGQPVRGGVAETVLIDVQNQDTAIRPKSLGVVKGALTQIDLVEADVVVAGGRGVGRAENFRLIEELAEVLGGKAGGSRYAVDAGWLPRDKQIGVSGKVVTPKLYIACGISGAVHHVEGMRDSKTIIAINKDRAAPIFKVADLGIVGDLLEVVPLMIEQVRKAMVAPAAR